MTYAQFVAGFHFSLVPLAWFNCFLFLTGGRSPSRAEETREAADEDETDQSESNVEPPNNQGLGKVGCFLETADHIKLKCLILLKKKKLRALKSWFCSFYNLFRMLFLDNLE